MFLIKAHQLRMLYCVLLLFLIGNRWFLLRHIVCCMEWAPQDWEYRDCQFLPIPSNQRTQNNLFRCSTYARWAGSEFGTRGLSWNGEV